MPEGMRNLIESYYSNVNIRFTTKEFTTNWQKVEKEIITRCTLSAVLFALTMTWLVLAVKDVTKGPKLSSAQQQENSRLLMDDMTTTTETIVQTRHLLEKLVDKLNWAGLAAKPEKCRSLIILKGEMVKREILLNGKPITSIQDKPIKYLGKPTMHSWMRKTRSRHLTTK